MEPLESPGGAGGGIPRHCEVGSCWCTAASDRNSTLASSSVTNASRSRSSSRSNTKEALYGAVLPRRTRLDEQSLHTNSPQPLPDALGRELSRESLRIFSGTPLQINRPLQDGPLSEPSPHFLTIAHKLLKVPNRNGVKNYTATVSIKLGARTSAKPISRSCFSRANNDPGSP